MPSPVPPSLPANELDRRLIALARSHQRLEASLCFYLLELEERALYSTLGFSSTVHYAKEKLGFDEKKTRALLRMAIKLKALPRLAEAFSRGELPWTKVREAIKVATGETEEEWIQKCRDLSNRQIELTVRRQEGPVRKKTLVFVLEEDQIESWDQVREALERLSGKSLTDIEAFELMCAEVLGTYAATPPFGFEEPDSESGGYARLIAERDAWVCARPGCACRVGLQAHHIVSRAKGGSDDPVNLVLTCASCHSALTRGQIWVRGRAPDELVWGAPWGIIEKPLPLSRERDRFREGMMSVPGETPRKKYGTRFVVRETEPPYGSAPLYLRVRDHVGHIRTLEQRIAADSERVREFFDASPRNEQVKPPTRVRRSSVTCSQAIVAAEVSPSSRMTSREVPPATPARRSNRAASPQRKTDRAIFTLVSSSRSTHSPPGALGKSLSSLPLCSHTLSTAFH